AVLIKVAPVGAELLLGQGRRSGHALAVQAASEAASAAPVLYPDDLGRKPRPSERAEDAAVMAEVAVVVGRALPDADGGQMRRPERRDLPLVHRIVRDAVQPDPAPAPGLAARPLGPAL